LAKAELLNELEAVDDGSYMSPKQISNPRAELAVVSAKEPAVTGRTARGHHHEEASSVVGYPRDLLSRHKD
jgi:hypothetical protein